ncbi:MAG: DUF4209 domain-containing protein [Gemmatimonadales bacterium]
MTDDKPRPSLDDFAAVDWQGAVADTPFRRLHEYAGRFSDGAKDAYEAEDTRAAAVYQGLADLCSLAFRPDRSEHPFSPWMVTQAFRTAGIEDLSDETITACGELCAITSDPRLRARLADVAWVRARDFRVAQTAVAAYLSLAEHIEPESWPEEIPYLERALGIGMQLGRGNAELVRVVQFIQGRLEHFSSTDNGFLCANLMDLLDGVRDMDAEKYAMMAADIARRNLSAREFHRAREYWTRAAGWAARAKDPDQRRSFLRELAESYVAEADATEVRPHVGSLLAATALQHAIEALRQAGGARERIDELHTRLVGVQRKAITGIPGFSQSADITEFVTQAERAVKGKSLEDALVVFAQAAPIPTYAHLRETAESHSQKYLFQSLFPKVFHNAEGKVIARQGSLTSSDPTEREAALRVETMALAAQYHEWIPQMTIDPMRRQLVREHAITARELLPLLKYNPFVPAGREQFYADGLVAGFYGDLVQAIHLIVPQLEHSIRVLLHRAGEQVSTLDQYGLQKELNLNNLLYRARLKELLGEDLVFALQGLLVEPPGGNIRNGMAHGLMSYGEFFSGTAMYLWWLTLRVTLLPGLIQLSEDRTPSEGRPGQGEEGFGEGSGFQETI